MAVIDEHAVTAITMIYIFAYLIFDLFIFFFLGGGGGGIDILSFWSQPVFQE